jgi:hypothetical protein
MVEETAQPAGIMTADLEGFSCSMAGIAMSLSFDDGCDYLVAYTRICSHFNAPFFGGLVLSGPIWAMVKRVQGNYRGSISRLPRISMLDWIREREDRPASLFSGFYRYRRDSLW